MRSTKDLIKDLDNEAIVGDEDRDELFTVLVVGFENESKTIFHNESNRLKRLNELVRNHGCPVGFIKAYRSGKELKFMTKLLPEVENDENCKKLLQDMSVTMEKSLTVGSGGT